MLTELLISTTGLYMKIKLENWTVTLSSVSSPLSNQTVRTAFYNGLQQLKGMWALTRLRSAFTLTPKALAAPFFNAA